MTDHDMIVEMRTDVKWIKDKLSDVCEEVWEKHPREHAALESRIRGLENVDAGQGAVSREKKDWTATGLAVVAIIVSVGVALAGVVWG